LVLSSSLFGGAWLARLLPQHLAVSVVLLSGVCLGAALPHRNPHITALLLLPAALPLAPLSAWLLLLCGTTWWLCCLISHILGSLTKPHVGTLVALSCLSVLCALPLGSAVIPEGARGPCAQVMVEASPLAAALYGIGYDWLRRPMLYESVPLGAFYPFREPRPWRTGLWFGLAAVPLAAISLFMRRRRLARSRPRGR